MTINRNEINKKLSFRYNIGDIAYKIIRLDSESIYILRCKIVAMLATMLDQPTDFTNLNCYHVKFLDVTSEDVSLGLDDEYWCTNDELYETQREAFIDALITIDKEWDD